MNMTLMLANTNHSQIASTALFYVFALMAGLSALGVVASRNIVRTAVCLLFTLLGVAGLYFLLDAEFLAAVQLVVYAGGTLILIVFGVMLTSKSPFSNFEPRPVQVLIAIGVAAVMLTAMIVAIRNSVFAQSPPLIPGKTYPMTSLGQALLGDYLVPFELASVLLLVVMIGAAYLAKGRKRDDKTVAKGDSTLSDKARQWS